LKLTSHPKLVLPSALVLAVAFNLSGLAFSFEPGCVKLSESLEPGILTDYATEVLEDAAFGRGETAPRVPTLGVIGLGHPRTGCLGKKH